MYVHKCNSNNMCKSVHSQISKSGSWANLSTICALKGDTEGADSSSLSAKAPIATETIISR